jgi:hypothetical protein
MKILKYSFAALVCAFCFFLGASSFAETEYLLVNGDRAVVEEKKLILIDRNSKRWIAPDGKYITKDERYTITVKGNEIRIKDHMKGLR